MTQHELADGRIRLYHGDCLDFTPPKADLVLADLPYEVVNRSDNGLRCLDKGIADSDGIDWERLLPWLDAVGAGSYYLFCSTEQVSHIREGLVSLGLTTRLCIWEKSNPSPMNGQHVWLSGVECCVFGKRRGGTFNEHCKNTVWKFPVERGKLHPTMKPLKLMSYLVGVSSNPGDTVLDFCMGSGSTGAACLATGRNFIGIEKEEEYFNIGVNRLEEAARQLVV